MPSTKTALTELGTALGLFWDLERPWPIAIEELEVPGIERGVWLPVIAPALEPGARARHLLHAALDNGRAFRRDVLEGRAPHLVEWTGADKSLWPSEVPRDLTVDHVWFIQAKHDSTCVLNTSPHAAFDLLLAETDTHTHQSWYAEVAPLELQAYYDTVRQATAPGELPPTVDELDGTARALLKTLMRQRDRQAEPHPDEVARYADLVTAVSVRTANHWQARLSRATAGQRIRLLLRMLRIAGGPYWLLGTKGHEPLRLEVIDTRRWRQRFDLRSFIAEPAEVGQPQVDWRAEVLERATRSVRAIEGYCEIRWSHGKLQGAPECKVQVTTPLTELPGYDPMRSFS